MATRKPNPVKKNMEFTLTIIAKFECETFEQFDYILDELRSTVRGMTDNGEVTTAVIEGFPPVVNLLD